MYDFIYRYVIVETIPIHSLNVFLSCETKDEWLARLTPEIVNMVSSMSLYVAISMNKIKNRKIIDTVTYDSFGNHSSAHGHLNIA